MQLLAGNQQDSGEISYLLGFGMKEQSYHMKLCERMDQWEKGLSNRQSSVKMASDATVQGMRNEML